MTTSEITAIIAVSLLVINFIVYWICSNNIEDPIDDLIPPIKEYEPTPTPIIKPIEKEPLLHSKCPNCGAHMTSNTCEYCDMTFYPELDMPSDLFNDTSPGYIKITPEGIFIEPYDIDNITKIIEDRVENRFEPTILKS